MIISGHVRSFSLLDLLEPTPETLNPKLTKPEDPGEAGNDDKKTSATRTGATGSGGSTLAELLVALTRVKF